jgi:hypothetical protein
LFFGFDFGFFGHVFLFYWMRDRIPRPEVLQVDFANRLRERTNFAYRAAMRHFVIRWLITPAAVMVAAAFVEGVPGRVIEPGERFQ